MLPNNMTDCFRYDAAAGLIYRKTTEGEWLLACYEMISRGKKYRFCQFGRKTLGAHRVAWFLTHGIWPDKEIDHINGDGCCNMIENLRPVTRALNQRNRKLNSNNKTGLPGVRQRRSGRFEVRPCLNGKHCHLGSVATIEEAKELLAVFHTEHGFHSNHGK